jgi:hypothetical protein
MCIHVLDDRSCVDEEKGKGEKKETKTGKRFCLLFATCQLPVPNQLEIT